MDEVDLPIKRNDAPTLKERMSENAWNNVLPARYMVQDENGDFQESEEEVFERVGQNIAVAEAAHSDKEIYIQHEHIKPDHPRREELIDNVFNRNGQKIASEVELTDRNAKYVSYDAVIDDLPENVKFEVEEYAEQFTEMMKRLKFMPNTPTIMNAGDELQQLSACFVDSPADDITDIHETAKEAAQIFQSGGGMGYGFWKLRPYGDKVGSTGGISSGPITFMRTYDQMCETIAQGGARRGAQMGIMRVSHPDVIQFIHAKNKDVSLAHTLRLNDPDDFTHNSFAEALEEARELITDEGKVPKHLRNAVEGHLSNFNISVGVTDGFMQALENGEEYTFTNPRTGNPHIATPETKELYELFDLGEYVEVGEELGIPAEEIWEDMVEGAHSNGEPGVIYLERANKQHSFDVEEHPDHQILATNPCGEQPLEEYEACNLGHINLSTVVSKDTPDWRTFNQLDIEDKSDEQLEMEVRNFLSNAVDWEELDRRIELGTRFLENVVTMSDFPIDEISETVRELRKIGLGIMGLAQMYIQMGVRYGSDPADEIGRQIMVYINQSSKRVSHEISDERGSFEEWDKSKYASPTEYPEWFNQQTGEDPEDWEDGYPIRNHNTTTIAPTGTTSMLGNTSGGCEPIYSVANYKNVSGDVQGDEMLVQFDDYFLRTLEQNNIMVEPVKEEAKGQMANNEFDGVDGLETVPDRIGELFVTTSDLSAKQHASIQCALQKGVDSAISKTVNAPSESTISDAKEVFEYIYENGGKGVTYYRDGTRNKQVLTTRAQNSEFSDDEDVEEKVDQYLEQEYDTSLDDLEESEDSEESEENSRPSKIIKDTDSSSPEERPKVLNSETHRINTSAGNMYVNVGYDDSGPFETFIQIGNSGGFTQSHTEAIGRLISLHLRSGGNLEDIINQLEGIRGPNVAWDNGEQINSIPQGVSIALQRFKQDADAVSEEESSDYEKSNNGTKEVIKTGANPECPQCGTMLVMQEGCEHCPDNECSYSKC